MSYALLSFAVDSVSASICERPTRSLSGPEFNAVWFKSQKQGMTLLPLLAMLPRIIRRFTMRLLNFVSSVMPSTKAYNPREKYRIPARLQRSLIAVPRRELGSTERTVAPKKLLKDDVYDLGGQLVQQAGINPMSSCLQTIITHSALNPAKRQKLRSELQSLLSASPTPSDVSWKQLEQLPYLDACINEGLRSFPRAREFNPERWLLQRDGHGGAKKIMSDYLVPFGKGSRDCLSKYQAHMTICHLLNELYKPGAPELDLYETDESDVALVHGYTFPLPRLKPKGVRVPFYGYAFDTQERLPSARYVPDF
ncbi:cytochrome P450 [Aspergillus filifer]